ncbi:MAG: putative Zn-dependent peptidase family [Nitrospira sp.]|jgi:zinc protease|nr:putative Zn-dependent peptidase family [Nitrospira sp.]
MHKQSTALHSLRTGFSILLFSFLISILPIGPAANVHAVEPKEFTLSNDMKVILIEVPKAPVVTVQVWYKVGSRNEVMGRAGLSHMLEHMMFKGTAKYPKGTFSRLVRKNGGMDNAFTSQDFTAYFENLAADRVALALELEADRMQGLLLDANELKTEREVVKEERRLRNEDDPQGALVETLFAQAFMSHPYHWPIIGWFSDLDAMNLDDLQRHYDTYYSPNNATLLVVGDIKADTLLPTIARLFEPIPKGPSPKPLTVAEAQQRGERRFLLKREAQVPFVMMGYRVPNYSSDDSYALNVLESILSKGKSARLYQSLVYDQKIALAVGADYGLMQADPGLFYFYAVVKPGEKVEAVEEAVLKEIHRLQTEPPAEQELQRAKNQIEAAHIFEQDSNFRQAMLLGEAETVGAGWRKVGQFVERTRAVTAQDIQRVASQYLTAEVRTTGILIPQPPSAQAASPVQAH